jgi:hypothetical protein
MNVRELRREQLSTGLVQSTYPEVEWRGGSRKLGKSPFYLAFETSLASIQQRGAVIQADYLRGDVAPEFTLPYSPAAWIDITPRVAYRYTYWTQSSALDPNNPTGVVDEPISRQLWSYGVGIIGPKMYRVFGKSKAPSRYKHTIEPLVTYGFDDTFDRRDEVLNYDEIDQIGGAGNRLTYALVQRLFAKKPQAVPEPPPSAADSIVLPDGTTYESTDTPESPDTPLSPSTPERTPAEPRAVPVEIGSLEFRQARSFDEDISSADLDGDGVPDSFSPYSPVSMIARVNPTPAVSVDLRSTYDILYKDIRDISISGMLRNQVSSLKFSFFRRNGLGVNSSTFLPNPNSTQAQATGGLSLLRDKMKLRAQVSYNADPLPDQSHFPEQRYQFIYSTQCCTFVVERLTREFAAIEQRRELYFRVDLRGVGKVVQKTF